MNVGDLVRHSQIKNTRQVGIITERNYHCSGLWKYKILWACIETEEYWFSNKDVEVICK